MKKVLIALALTSSLATSGLVSAPAFAQSTSGAASTMPLKNDQLYQSLGQKAGLESLMDIFVAGLKADPRTGPHFKETNSKGLQEQLVDQFCKISGGPCEYKGANMKAAHADMDISKTDFNALVEVLQASMDARHIPFATQNKLLALLAPMHRDVITVK